jgi:hypothetical protein
VIRAFTTSRSLMPISVTGWTTVYTMAYNRLQSYQRKHDRWSDSLTVWSTRP